MSFTYEGTACWAKYVFYTNWAPPLFWALARCIYFACVLVFCFIGCAGKRPGPPLNLPKPVTSTTIGPGDVFEVIVVGEKDLPREFKVSPDGTIDFPYISRLHVSGLEPQEIVLKIEEQLIQQKIWSTPQVSVFVKQYNSKKVTVIGQVAKPGSIVWLEGLKMVDAISQAGWFTPLADSNHVILTRNVPGNKTVTTIISVEAITDGDQSDISLQAGDTIKVEARIF